MSAIPVQDWTLVLSDHLAVFKDGSYQNPTTFIRKLNTYINPNIREAVHEGFIKRDGKFYSAESEPYFSHFEPVGFVPYIIAYDPLQGKQIEIVP